MNIAKKSESAISSQDLAAAIEWLKSTKLSKADSVHAALIIKDLTPRLEIALLKKEYAANIVSIKKSILDSALIMKSRGFTAGSLTYFRKVDAALVSLDIDVNNPVLRALSLPELSAACEAANLAEKRIKALTNSYVNNKNDTKITANTDWSHANTRSSVARNCFISALDCVTNMRSKDSVNAVKLHVSDALRIIHLGKAVFNGKPSDVSDATWSIQAQLWRHPLSDKVRQFVALNPTVKTAASPKSSARRKL
jgi:hypothetical protein